MTVIVRDTLFWGSRGDSGKPVGIPTRMIYSTADPYAVKLIFGHRSGLKKREQVEWIFARDLLALGIFEETGDGDVRVGPIGGTPEMAGLTLIGRESQVTLLVKKTAVAQFLDLTYGLCAQGDENRFMTSHL